MMTQHETIFKSEDKRAIIIKMANYYEGLGMVDRLGYLVMVKDNQDKWVQGSFDTEAEARQVLKEALENINNNK